MNQIIQILINLITQFLSKPDPIPAAVAAQATKEALHSGEKSLELKRMELTAEGIFSTLSMDGKLICWTAEHAYDSKPKLPNGTWVVKLGTHTLDHGGPKQLYCVQNVPEHSGICFHVGNSPQTDSDGCLLLGSNVVTVNGVRMVVSSQHEFDAFMALMSGVAQFTLVVS